MRRWRSHATLWAVHHEQSALFNVSSERSQVLHQGQSPVPSQDLHSLFNSFKICSAYSAQLRAFLSAIPIGTFIQNLEYAATYFGYGCNWNLLAKTNQDKQVMEVKLKKKELKNAFDIAKIKNRRTVRSDFLTNVLKKEDIKYLQR